MESQGLSLENYISAWGLTNFICNQMVLGAAFDLNVFNILSNSGPGAHLTVEEIASRIPTANHPNAILSLERMLRLLSVSSLLSTSLRPCPNDKSKQERTYALTKDTLCLVSNENGVSLAPILKLSFEIAGVKSLYMLKHCVLEEGCDPFYKAHGETMYEHISKKPEFGRLFSEAMTAYSAICFDQKVFTEYRGFEEVTELMDVGGGMGNSLAKIVSKYPYIHGINFDLPDAIARAPKYQG